MRYKTLYKTTLQLLLAVGMLLAVLFPMLGEAGPMGKAKPPVGKGCESRDFSEFLITQGTSSQFFPPVQDYAGWTDGKFTTFALVDYAGLADKYIKEQKGFSLGTEVTGSVLECALADDRTEITVALSTTKALGFAQSIAVLTENNFDFLNTPTIFGAKAQDVVSGAAAATGPVSLFTTFSIKAPGDPLPDFLDVVNNPASYAPVKFSFMSKTCGTTPDGRKARLDVHEMASTNEDNELIYSVEHVKVVRAQGGNCGD